LHCVGQGGHKGFGGTSPEKKLVFFAFVFGSFSAHGFRRWLSNSVKELGLLTIQVNGLGVLDVAGSYIYCIVKNEDI
jgi:hypothetical protein